MKLQLQVLMMFMLLILNMVDGFNPKDNEKAGFFNDDKLEEIAPKD
jgi:hypothetical protein